MYFFFLKIKNFVLYYSEALFKGHMPRDIFAWWIKLLELMKILWSTTPSRTEVASITDKAKLVIQGNFLFRNIFPIDFSIFGQSFRKIQLQIFVCNLFFLQITFEFISQISRSLFSQYTGYFVLHFPCFCSFFHKQKIIRIYF